MQYRAAANTSIEAGAVSKSGRYQDSSDSNDKMSCINIIQITIVEP